MPAWIGVTIVALALDHFLGEPRRAHPLVAFGCVATWVERHCYGNKSVGHKAQRWRGVIAVALLLLPLTSIVYGLVQIPLLGFVVSVVVLYLALGGASLAEHGQRVAAALQQDELRKAREGVSQMVSRDTADMKRSDVIRATVESVLENGNDAIFAALFWFFVAGAPGVVCYRLANTLDAMWGYRNERYTHFGWAAARLDDVLNYLPARLTALTYAICGNFRRAIYCWFQQGSTWCSPNAGPVMAAGAGAMGIHIGGEAVYHGQLIARPILGLGVAPETTHINDAIKLVRRGIGLWIVVVFLGGWIIA